MSGLKCLVLMPFADEFDPVFQTVQAAVQDAPPDRSTSCEWIKHVHPAGCITDDIVSGIEQSVRAQLVTWVMLSRRDVVNRPLCVRAHRSCHGEVTPQ